MTRLPDLADVPRESSAVWWLLDTEDLTGCHATAMTLASALKRRERCQAAVIAPAAPADSLAGRAIASAIDHVVSELDSAIILRHAALIDTVLEQRERLRHTQTLQLGIADRAIGWTPLSYLLDSCLRGIGDLPAERLGRPVAVLEGEQIAELMSEGIRRALDPDEFIRLTFELIHNDASGTIETDELVDSLIDSGVPAFMTELIAKRLASEQGSLLERDHFASTERNLLGHALEHVNPNIRFEPVDRDQLEAELIRQGLSVDDAELAADYWVSLPDAAEDPRAGGPGGAGSAENGIAVQRFLHSHAPEWLGVHVLPGGGVVRGWPALIDGAPGYRSLLMHSSGREMRGGFTSDLSLLDYQWVHPEENPRSADTITFGSQTDFRSLIVENGRIVRVTMRGRWNGVRHALPLLFQGESLPPWRLALFRELGELNIAEAAPRLRSDIICKCSRVTCGLLEDLVGEGINTIGGIARACRATIVCGGCRPLVEEIIGSSELQMAEIIEKRYLGGAITRIRLRPVETAMVAPAAGQHVVLQGHFRSRWVTRAYTLTSTPDDPFYEISVKFEPGGEFSPWLTQEADGSSLIRVSRPQGDFRRPPADESNAPVVFFAGGIGITPAVALARTFDGEKHSPMIIDWSTHFPEQQVFRRELEEIAQRQPHLDLVARATRGAGHLCPETIAATYPASGFSAAMVCGPDHYMASVRESLLSAGWSATRILQERFSSQLDENRRALPLPRLSGSISGVEFDLIEQAGTMLSPAASVAAEAEAFLLQCYAEHELSSVAEARVADVLDQVRLTGTYEHTYDELRHGARLAWRNSSRCLGRDLWQSLEVRDMRQLNSAAEMFDAICEHIAIATNGGDLRAVMTLFRPDGRRIWNSQFFRYAGYVEADGSVLGDPENTALTKAVLALGWEPPSHGRSRFDYLPIVIQLPGFAPEWFTLPPELITEVPIRHPELTLFEELDLVWYGLPAVSNMAFDVGGVQYTAAPFNGFYMGTEIGARDFGDTNRYNMLPAIAAAMGLDTSREQSLWKDRALVELNIAVLHSFTQAGVRIADHHTLTQSFERFCEKEHAGGRRVQADPRYTTPPISACATATFQKEYDGNRMIKPNFFYQRDPF